MSPAELPALRIGEFRVDSALDQISKDGTTIKLEPRSMRLLLCLAERPGQVVSVEEMLDTVWKDVVVTPDSVYQAIAGLRRALGDDPRSPTYIANVLRRGYRLVAPVRRDESTAGPAEPPPITVATLALPGAPLLARPEHVVPAPTTSTPRVRRRRWLIASVGAAVALALLGVWLGVASLRAARAGRDRAVAAPASVAVLPFLDLSESKDQAYFADGMSEELIDVLAKVPGLRVPARTSSFYFRDRAATISEIARALQVSHLLEGSVRKSGNTIRITTQLVRADNGYHVWSATFDRPLDDVFRIQDEIAGQVVRALKVSLLAPAVPSGRTTSNTDAYALYLQARALEQSAGTADFAAAAADLKRALALDPNYAAAWAELASALSGDFDWHEGPARSDRCAEARQAVDRALTLEPTLSEAHRASAALLSECDGDTAGAEREYKRALELDPGNAHAWRSYSFLVLMLRRPDEAIRLGQEAVIRDPLNAWSYFPLAWALGSVGRHRDAEALYRKALEIDPTASGLHALHANALLALNDPSAALAELELESDEQFRAMNLALVYDALGRQADADREIAIYALKYGERDPITMAVFYACRKDADHALAWLEHTLALHAPIDDVPNRIACLSKIKDDPRYVALFRKWQRPLPPPS